MIIKHVSMLSVSKSSVEDLLEYLTDDQEKQVRVGEIELTNLNSIDLEGAILEIENTQDKNTRSKADKTYHLIISFAPSEVPSKEVLRDIENTVCNSLGFEGHQRVSVAHDDTDSFHIHVAINKINPVSNNIVEPYFPYKTLAKVAEQLEEKHGLVKTNHTPYYNSGRSKDIDNHAGLESLVSYVRENCSDQLSQAKNWDEFNKILAENGLEIKERGNGLVVGDGSLYAKASTVSREFSKKSLEKKFGGFEKNDSVSKIKPKRKYTAKPISNGYDTTLLFAQYQEQQKKARSSKDDLAKHASNSRKKRIEIAKEDAKRKREIIKKMPAQREVKKLAYKAINDSLARELKNISTDYQKARKLIWKKCGNQSWADWLRDKAMSGDKDAMLALRHRSDRQNLSGDTITGNSGIDLKGKKDSVTKNGTVIFKTKHAVIRDDAKSIKVTKGMSTDAMVTALRAAVDKYGEVLKINGTDEFKEKMVFAAASSGISVKFDDEKLEAKRLEKLSEYPTRNRPDVKRSWHGGKRKFYKRNLYKSAERAKAKKSADMRKLQDVAMAHQAKRNEVLLQDNARDNLVNRKPTSGRKL